MGTNESLDTLSLRIIELMNSEGSISEKLLKALSFLCTSFGYKRGYVYQNDGVDAFQLKEGHGDKSTMLQYIIKRNIAPELINYMRSTSFFMVNDTGDKTDIEVKLSEFVQFSSYAFHICRDINGTFVGLVGLADKVGNNLKRQSEIETVRILLSMLSREIVIREYESREQRATETLESIMDNMGIDIYVNEFNTHEMLYANKSMAEPYGGITHFKNKKCWQALYTDKKGECDFCPQQKLIDENGKPTKVYSWDYQRPFDKSWFRVLSAAFPWIDGRMAHVVSSVDITENKKYEALIKQMAEQDSLTGLPNRRKLVEDLDFYMYNNDPQEREGYLLFLDLDGFKQVNDNMGHQSGDELLIQMADYYRSFPEISHHVYRQSGDEFIIILPKKSREEVISIAKKILDKFNHPWILKEGSANCNVSIGVAHYPTDSDDAERLLQIADATMYLVKRNGKQGIRFANEECNLVL
ncbi:GGDEF domain-containing protein [Odoribacter sp. OttesenSCG-928-A06]|nr:GGDEF domain-containing protein [Odoribacter sp. OttesenSCG-928-A06]